MLTYDRLWRLGGETKIGCGGRIGSGVFGRFLPNRVIFQLDCGHQIDKL